MGNACYCPRRVKQNSSFILGISTKRPTTRHGTHLIAYAPTTGDGRRKTGMLILAALFVIALSFKLDLTNLFNISTRSFHTPPQPAELKMSYLPTSNDVSDPHDPRFYNIILEDEALKFRPCDDVENAASIRHSKVSLTDRVNRTYNIGEYVRAIVTLYDGYGKRKYSGGDQLRATIENRAIRASAPCTVTDNNNGTHTAACEVLWSGTSTIYVVIAYTRETITTIYWMRTEVLGTRHIAVQFQRGNYSEDTTCHSNDAHLLKLTSYTHVCNLTRINKGESFYCGKPKNKHLQCQDIQLAKANKVLLPPINFTECERILFKRGQQTIIQTISVKVRSKNSSNRFSVIDNPLLPCSEYNRSLLWRSRTPTGFFYDGKWNLRNCLGFQENHYSTCFKNRRLYIFGDSTTRPWYQIILKRFKCQHITQKWNKQKWYKDSECYNTQLNFKAGWYPHAQPFFVRTLADTRDSEYSNVGRLVRIPRNSRAIVVIHFYMHMVEFHHSVFIQRMETIRKGVDRFLLNNKQSVVMIKAPHTYENPPYGGYRLNDYVGYLYSKLLYEIFEGLHERVILLNNKDATIAKHVKENHPPKEITNAMVDQMLSYACD